MLYWCDDLYILSENLSRGFLVRFVFLIFFNVHGCPIYYLYVNAGYLNHIEARIPSTQPLTYKYINPCFDTRLWEVWLHCIYFTSLNNLCCRSLRRTQSEDETNKILSFTGTQYIYAFISPSLNETTIATRKATERYA